MRFKKGDKVQVMKGKDSGKSGVIERVYSKQSKVLIKNINVYKKHVKKNQDMPQGGVVEVPRPLLVSKVALVCPKCGKLVKIGFKVEGGKKNRICKKCKSVI